MSLQTTAEMQLSRVLLPPRQDEDSAAFGLFVRLAMVTAMMSAMLETVMILFTQDAPDHAMLISQAVIMTLALPLVLSEKYSRAGIVLFALVLLFKAVTSWHSIANHAWLAVWTIPAAALLSRWWEQHVYADYLRVTLGVVMLAAAGQKLLAGTYLDGTYIAFLSHFGGTTEQMFSFLCSKDTLQSPCGWHKFLGTFIVCWQIGVGILLLAGLRNLLFLFIEISFLLGAGVFADEMNFQVLNIALLCIAFRVGMSWLLFAICAAVLIIDVFTLGWFVELVL